ncbi:MAG: FHA domain-containing protein, partial [Tannerellaceae bacterium]|nr:FHA domain-containing protein [Tannerellaceae bacterium]
MPAKITVKITKGELSGKEFVFDQRESLVLGRHNDCPIQLPESTVSRYHCILEIAPPSVLVRDFGSLNGTYLNGKKIGQREASMSVEEGKKMQQNKFPMKAGDHLKLGSDCELAIDVKIPQYCADCLSEIEEPEFTNAEKMPVCADCHAKAKKEEELRKKKNEPAPKPAPKPKPEPVRNKRRCVCGAVVGGPNEPDICPECRKDPIRLLKYLLEPAKEGVGEDAREIAGYRNIKRLGKGGMGEALLVEEEATGKEMVLKFMLPEVAANEHCKDLFLREAYITGQLMHKNVVRQHQSGRSGDVFFILLEYCRGGSVDKLMQNNNGKLKLDLATHIMLQVLDGLHHVHNAR